MKTTFSVTSYFDPFGDGKSQRKPFRRKFYHSDKTKQEIVDLFAKTNELRSYYQEETLVFKNYKRTLIFD